MAYLGAIEWAWNPRWASKIKTNSKHWPAGNFLNSRTLPPLDMGGKTLVFHPSIDY